MVRGSFSLAATGQTVVLVAVDNRLAGLLGVADPIRASTPDAIRSLHEDGLRIIMLTGDNLSTARAVAGRLGIDEVSAEVLPGQKQQVIERSSRKAIPWSWPATASTIAGPGPGKRRHRPGQRTDVAIESARHNAHSRRPARHRPRPPPQPGYHAKYSPKPVPGVYLQRRQRARGGRSPLSSFRNHHQPHMGERRDEPELAFGRRQRTKTTPSRL